MPRKPDASIVEAEYGQVDSAAEKRAIKFDAFLEMVLDQFCETNPDSCREQEEATEVDEVALRRFLKIAMAQEVAGDFGEVPNIRVR